MEGRILALLQAKYSQPQIVKLLKQDGISIFQKAVSNVKRKIDRQRNSVEKIKFFRKRSMSTPSIISRVIQTINVEDPPTQRSMAESCHASQSPISRIIKQVNFTL